MVPVNMAITIKALPTFVLIIHCRLGTFGAPNLIHISCAHVDKSKNMAYKKETL